MSNIITLPSSTTDLFDPSFWVQNRRSFQFCKATWLRTTRVNIQKPPHSGHRMYLYASWLSMHIWRYAPVWYAAEDRRQGRTI